MAATRGVSICTGTGHACKHKAHFSKKMREQWRATAHDIMEWTHDRASDDIQMIQDLTPLCQKGGFALEKWISSSCAVLHANTTEQRAKNLKVIGSGSRQAASRERSGSTMVCGNWLPSDSRMRLGIKHLPDMVCCEPFAQYKIP